MNNIQKNKNFTIRYIALILMLCVFSTLLFSLNTYHVNAEDIEYSFVLDDLKKDEGFSIDNYPLNEGNYSIELIQVAESVNNELFVYVYQPSSNLLATSINMSTDYRSVSSFFNYKLKYINHDGSLYKYVVENFVVSDDLVRYYEISSIFRLWNEKCDEILENGNTVTEVSYPVAKQYILSGEICKCFDIETISVTDKYVGFVRYIGGLNFWGSSDYVDSHFVAFSTDKKINNLQEADIYFDTQDKIKIYGQEFEYKDIVENYAYMTSLETAVFKGNYTTWINSSYEWQRIQTVDEFVASEDFTKTYKCGIINLDVDYELDSETKQNIENCQWVLRFYESKYSKSGIIPGNFTQWTSVFNVSLLRLKFETEGKIYNLGVIDNKVSGDEIPDNDMTIRARINWGILIGVGIAVLLLFLLLFAPGVFFAIVGFLFKCIVFLVKGFVWVITSPIAIFESD